MALYRNILKVKNPPGIYIFFSPKNINVSVTREKNYNKTFSLKICLGKKNLTEGRDFKLNGVINTF